MLDILALAFAAQVPINLDTRPGPPLSIAPTEYVEFQGRMLFVSNTNPLAPAVLSVDPATGGSQVLLRLVWTAPTVVGSRVVFGVTLPETGLELWVTDGTPAGTVPLPEIVPGATGLDNQPLTLTVAGNRAYFVANTPGFGRELWVTDGTPAGTHIVLDLAPGPTWSSPLRIGALGSQLLFVAFHPSYGFELWRTDGTSAGTNLVIDWVPGTASPDYGFPVPYGNLAVFGLTDPQGAALMRTDGTAAGTSVFMRPTTPEFRPITAGPYLETTFGVAFRLGSGEIWVTDATAAGTHLLWRQADPTSPVLLFADAAGLTFSGRQFSPSPTEVYHVTSPQSPRQTLVSFPNNPTISALGATANGALFGLSGLPTATWRTDGTAIGTYEVRPNGAQLSSFRLGNLGPRVLLGADTGDRDIEMWASDSTLAGTRVFLETPGNGELRSTPVGHGRVGDRALVSSAGVLYAIDASGSQPLATIVPGPSLIHDSRFYFVGNQGTTGDEPWVSDGTPGGTFALADLVPGRNGSTPFVFAAADRDVLFLYNDGAGNTRLARTDGTASGTVALARVAGVGSPDARLIVVDGVAYALVVQGASRASLVRSDGTSAGTQELLNFFRFDERYELAALGSRILFTADTIANGTELWTSDGTIAGTVLLKDIRPGTGNSTPRFLGRLGGALIFSAIDTPTGNELWRSDGTATGTALLADLAPGPGSSDPVWFGQSESQMYFSSTTAVGREAWRTDGTVGGTSLVADLWPGSVTSNSLAAALGDGDRLILLARTQTGSSLWRSDGTPSSTQKYVDLPPLVDHLVVPPIRIGNRLYFFADAPGIGREPWAIDLGFGVYARYGRPCTGSTSPRVSASSRPVLGNPTFAFQLTDAPAQTPATLMLGLQRTDLPLGACRLLLASVDVAIPSFTGTDGRASATLPIPALAELIGSTFYGQWAVVMSGGPVFDVGALSDGLEVTLGL